MGGGGHYRIAQSIKNTSLAAVIILLLLASASADSWGSEGTDDGQFNSPGGVAVDGVGNVYVADGGNDRIQKFMSNGTFIMKWGSKGTGDGQFLYPSGIAVDGGGNVYVTDSLNRVQKFTSAGAFIATWGSDGSGDGQFNDPRGVAVDADGNVYVADTNNNRIQKFTSSGTFLGWWGKDDLGGTGWHAPDSGRTGAGGSGDGQFAYPQGIAVDGSGNVYVVDHFNRRIQMFTSNGAFIMKWGSYGTGDGQLYNPRGIAEDGVGNVYVTDSLNRVQKFTSAGAFIAKWGDSVAGASDGQFNQPVGVAVDDVGNVYIADTGNNRIQMFRMNSSLLSLSFDNTLEGADGETPTTSTGIEFADGVSGKGVKLEGSDKLHYTPQGNIDLSSGTVEMWVRPLWDEATARDDHRFLLAATEEYHKNELRLYRRGGEGLHIMQFTMLDSTGVPASIAGSIEGWKVDEWHHVAATWDVRTAGSGEMRIFIDGKSAGETTSLSLSMGDAVLPLRIGAEFLDRFQPNAVIDELRILNYPLSAEYIQERYSDMKPLPTPASTITTTPTANDWPMFGRDLQHTGVTTGGPGSDLELAWTFETEDIIISSPIIVDGIVYIGTDDGNMYAINADTGSSKWTYDAERTIRSTAAFADGKVFFTSRGVYALDAATGSLLWRSLNTTTGTGSSPLVTGGIIYVGMWNNHTYALDASTGATLWSYEMGAPITSAPAYEDGVIYLGSWDTYICALDARTGDLLWRFKTNDGIVGAPVIEDGIVVVGSGGYDKHLYALDASSGTKKWDFASAKGIMGGPAIDNGRIIFASLDYQVYNLDLANGNVVWNITMLGRASATPAVSDGIVYIGLENNTAMAIDLGTGKILWSYDTGGKISYSSAAIGAHIVVFGSHDYSVYAFRAKAGTAPIPTPSPVATTTPTPTTTPTSIPDTTTTPSPVPDATTTPTPTPSPVATTTPTPTTTPTSIPDTTTTPSPVPDATTTPTPAPSTSDGPTAAPSAAPTAGPADNAIATPTTAPATNDTKTPAPSTVPDTPTPAPSTTPTSTTTPALTSAPPTSPTMTVAPLLDNGKPCTANSECQSDNCGGGVCCILGMTCCDADADCPPDNKCETERFYCVPESDESLGKGAEARIAELLAKIDKLKQESPEVEFSSVELLITQANEKLSAGEFVEAHQLSVEAMSALDEAQRSITLPIGGTCFENVECETVNCQNKICCKAGKTCCDKDAHCDEDEVCDTDRSYCVSKEDEGKDMSLQERIVEVLTDPIQLVTIVAAIVVGLGFGLYQLKGRIEEKKTEDRYERMAEQVEQMQQAQYYQGPGGQMQQTPGFEQNLPQQGWGQPPLE